MRFRDYFSVKHILFAVALIALMMFFAVRQSNDMVKVYFEDTSVDVVSSKYSMNIPYDMVESAALADLAEAGERLAECYDDDIIRTGFWGNDTWGEYYIVADLDPDNCIVVHLNDGRMFVFSRKSNAENEKLFETLQTYLSAN